MKFGVIGSVSKPTTYDTAGGVEVWTALFLLESVKRGHTFDLYGLKDSLTIPEKIRLISIAAHGVDAINHTASFQEQHPREYDYSSLLGILFSRINLYLKEHEAQYDMIINSSGSPFFPVNWDLYHPPLVTIGHFNAFEPYVSYFEYFPLPPHIFYVFPTQREYHLAKEIPESQKFYVPHGIDSERIPFERGKRTHLLWFGRLDPKMPKGLPEALTISNTLKIPINIYTYVEDPNYFRTHIKPLFSQYTHFYTNIPRQEYFKNAKVLVIPLGWEEPFGLTFLEAMASGTPVIAFARGSVPEIIQDGETGFIVNWSETDSRGNWITQKTGTAGICEAIERVYALSDADYTAMQWKCRERVENHFTIAKMVDGYETVYQKIFQKELLPASPKSAYR